MSFNRKLAIVGGVITFLWIFVALWWWAIIGMSKDVGTAHVISVLLVGSASAFLTIE